MFTSDPYTVIDINLPPTDALAGIEVDADGGIEKYINAGNQGDIGRWDNGLMSLDKSDYQFRLDTITGTTDNGDALDTWLPAIAGFNHWDREVTGTGNKNFTGTLRMRLAISPFTEFDTAAVTLHAEATP
jgi:hypothetical protein